MDFKAEIANISNEATQEIGLEELLAKVQNKVSEIYKVQTKSFNKWTSRHLFNTIESSDLCVCV